MKVTLQGETFGFSGKIKGYTKSGLIDYMRDQGAGVSNASPNRSMSCFLVGDRAADKKIDAARALGLTLIEGDDLYALLEHGEVTLTEAAKLSLDDLIGSARALLAKTPSHAVWLELMALVDTCDEEHIEALIVYILPQTSRWPSCVLEEERTYHERQYGEFGFSASDAGKMAALLFLQLLPLRGNPQVFSASEIKGLKKASGHLPDNLLIHDWHILS